MPFVAFCEAQGFPDNASRLEHNKTAALLLCSPRLPKVGNTLEVVQKLILFFFLLWNSMDVISLQPVLVPEGDWLTFRKSQCACADPGAQGACHVPLVMIRPQNLVPIGPGCRTLLLLAWIRCQNSGVAPCSALTMQGRRCCSPVCACVSPGVQKTDEAASRTHREPAGRQRSHGVMREPDTPITGVSAHLN